MGLSLRQRSRAATKRAESEAARAQKLEREKLGTFGPEESFFSLSIFRSTELAGMQKPPSAHDGKFPVGLELPSRSTLAFVSSVVAFL